MFKINKLKSLLLSVFLFSLSKGLVAQQSVADTTININIVNISTAFQLPAGDIAKQFGFNATIGAGYYFKSNSNWIYGFDWAYIFGKVVKNRDELLSMISTEHGEIISSLGQYSAVHLFERGHTFMFKTGKLFPALSPNLNSGFYILGSAGVLTHKTRIEVKDNDAPQLDIEYRRGYDHARLGPAVGLELGYMYLSNQRLINFKISLEGLYGITYCIRPYNFDQMQKDNKLNNDFLFGVKLSWLLPLYPKTPKEYYYN